MCQYGKPAFLVPLPSQPLQKLFAAHGRAVGAERPSGLSVGKAGAVGTSLLQHARSLLERSRVSALSGHVNELELKFSEVHWVKVCLANDHHHQLLGSIQQQARLSPSKTGDSP
jgi:hypothetical protein